jgi:hypothetical protein
LSDRYGLTLPALAEAVEALEREVAKHLARMGHS